MSEEKKSTRGGRREGAGRPGSNSKLYTFRAPGTLIPYIDSQENKTEFFKRCITNQIESEKQGRIFERQNEIQSITNQSESATQQREMEEDSYLCKERDLQQNLTMEKKLQNTSNQQRASNKEHLEKMGIVYPAETLQDMKLPFFDIKLVAGFPIPLDNDERAEGIELLKMLCPHPESSYLIRVEGDSMIDANIHTGDIVIVDKSNRNPTANEVAVCELNGEYTLKRFEIIDGIGWLVPANPDFPRIRVTEDDQFSIWGTVTYTIHRPKF